MVVAACGDDGGSAGGSGGSAGDGASGRTEPGAESESTTGGARREGLRPRAAPEGPAAGGAAGSTGGAPGAATRDGAGAKPDDDPALAAQLADPLPGGPRFVDGTAAAGITHVNLSGPAAPDKFYLRDTVGQGIAVLDADGDGELDLYFVQGSDGTPDGGDSANRLYVNEGGRRFVEQGRSFGVDHRGYGYGALAFDPDNDGDDDLFVTNLGPDVLLRNDVVHAPWEDAPTEGAAGDDGADAAAGDVTPGAAPEPIDEVLPPIPPPMFFETTGDHVELAGEPEYWSVGSAAGDVDGDGALDLYVARYCAQEYEALDERGLCRLIGCEVPCGPRSLPPQPDAFFMNSGAPDYTLAPAGEAAGLSDVELSYGFQPTFLDVDDDGDLDLYVTNDSMFNFLFVNDGQGRFEETGLMAGAACGNSGVMEAGMGLAVGHLDDDAYPEMWVTNFSTQNHSLYHNVTEPGGAPWFEEISGRSGTGRPTWFPLGWGAQIADLDADGHVDLFAANSHIYPQVDGCQPDLVVYEQRCNVFTGTDEHMRFADRTGRVGPGLSGAGPHRASVAADLDDDGRLDLVVSRLDRTPLLAWNDTPDAGHWLGVDVRRVDVEGGPALRAVGARVTVTAGERSWTRDVQAGGSFVSTDDPRVHVGLGEAEVVDTLSVRLTGGQTLGVAGDLPVDRRFVLTVGPGDAVELRAVP